MTRLTVILPTHSPNPGKLARVLRSLRLQTLPLSDWELLLIDNASIPALDPAALRSEAPVNLRAISEPKLGLSHARRRGFLEARGDFFVLVDDDNVLSPNYLHDTIATFDSDSRLGAIGGPCQPEFENPPAPWQKEFFGLLALRDFGPSTIIENLRSSDSHRDSYPLCAPIGAGMSLRRAAVEPWLAHADPAVLSDRRGGELTSGGDNDIIIHALRAGWHVGYFPELILTHLIPDSRLHPAYLARLNRGIQKSWMHVLSSHNLNPWPPISRWSVPLRQLKAWFTHRAWSSPAARIRWQGACGHFLGRVPSKSSSASNE